MKYSLLIFVLVFASASLFASSKLEKDLFFAKISFEQKAHQLKLSNEKELIRIKEKNNFNAFEKNGIELNNFEERNEDCIEFVYKGPASREESAVACQGVRSMECVEFVYKGASSREESAIACRGVTEMSCVESVYKGPSSREESARSCADVRAPHPRRPDEC